MFTEEAFYFGTVLLKCIAVQAPGPKSSARRGETPTDTDSSWIKLKHRL